MLSIYHWWARGEARWSRGEARWARWARGGSRWLVRATTRGARGATWGARGGTRGGTRGATMGARACGGSCAGTTPDAGGSTAVSSTSSTRRIFPTWALQGGWGPQQHVGQSSNSGNSVGRNKYCIKIH